MKRSFGLIALVAAVGMAIATGPQQGSMQTRRSGMRIAMPRADDAIRGWLDEPQKAAHKMISKYGQPDEVTDQRLVWNGAGPWKRIILVNEEIPHNFPMPHHDMLEQFIDYKVPPQRADELARYDGSVIVERTKGEMSARCDKEEANFLAINLANDVATGKRTVDGARKFYSDTIMALMKMRPNPEQKRYTSGFTFRVSRGMTGDKDHPRHRM
jgi:hypothetical protein